VKIEYENRWFKVIKDGDYHFLKENGSDNGAIVIAIVDGYMVFVNIYRPVHKLHLIELPRGYGDLGESSRLCASRELQEETGHRFESEKFKKIGVVRPNSAILSSSVSVYLVESLENISSRKIDSEVSSIKYISEQKIYKEISSGRISDGMTLSALALYWAYKK